MKTSEQINKILPALFAVKQELVAVAKSSDNPFFKSKYADLNTHLDDVEPRLAKVGCVLFQPVNADNTVESRIIHVESGQWISSEMQLIVSKNTMQDAGSAVTYARRYTLGALLSMKAEDDDGEKSMGRGASTKQYNTQPTSTAKGGATEAKPLASSVTPTPAATVSTPAKPAVEPFKKTGTFAKKKPVEPVATNVSSTDEY